jgi:hypothetical protein
MFDINNDPLLSGYQNSQAKIIEEYRRKVETQSTSRTPLWDKIDAEIAPLTDEQKIRVLNDEDYLAKQSELQQIINEQVLMIVKPYVEQSERGKQLLGEVYDVVQVAKKKAVQETNKEMELFRQWQDYSRKHPEATYAEFLKNTKKK